MINIKQSTAFKFDYLQLMDMVIKIETKLAGNESIWGLAVKQAIHNGKPAALIIKSIKEMAQDNFNVVADALGVKLTNQILSHE